MAFSDAWAKAWCGALNGSAAYRAAAAGWEGSVALVAGGDEAVFLDLWHGACRSARRATAADRAEATFVLEAEPSVWRDLLEAKQSPVLALVTGRLRLARGELGRLLPHVGAAKELLVMAETVGAVFPEGWGTC